MKTHTRDRGAADGTRHLDDQRPTTPDRQIHLPCFGITVHLDQECSPGSPARGSITSQLKEPGRGTLVRTLNAAIDGLEALILRTPVRALTSHRPATSRASRPPSTPSATICNTQPQKGRSLMGLTIHYSLRSTRRSPTKVRDLIRRLRSRALDLPFERVDEIVEFKGTECDFQARDQDDQHRWLLIQSRQLVPDPREDDRRYAVNPQHVIAFSTWPGHGCEEANFGSPLAPRHHGG